jgi:aminopeptidase N
MCCPIRKPYLTCYNILCTNLWLLARVRPVHYDISLSDLEFGGDWKYKGVVKIDTKVTKATKEIVLNVKELEIQSAKVWTAEAKSMSRPHIAAALDCSDFAQTSKVPKLSTSHTTRRPREPA